MKHKHLLLPVLFIFTGLFSFSQTPLWTDQSVESIQSYVNSKKDLLPQTFRVVKLNRSAASQLQSRAPLENGTLLNITASVQFEIPLPGGSNMSGAFTEAPILSAQLQQQYQYIKTYRLTEAITKNQLGRITITPAGVSGLLFTNNGSVYISPLGNEYPDVHMVYYIKDLKTTRQVHCALKEDIANLQPAAPNAGDCQLRIFRLAIAATGEYTLWAGSQANAIGYITTTVNNVTAIYERDATIRLTLVTNNSVVFPDSATDPYPPLASPNGALLTTNHNTLNTNIGSGLYDVGMVFNDGWDGGLAALGVVCNNTFKGRAASGLTFGTGANPDDGPQGPIFDVTVAHELGHQFSATHSFAATNGGCAGNATAGSAWEPGGGSTIMAYANVCSPNFYQSQVDHYFHAGNIGQIQSYVTGGSASCVTPTPILNTPPLVTVPAGAYVIPHSTPFTLSSTGTDFDGNTLLYTWEQMDAGVTTTSPPLSTNVAGPNFRSYPPSTDPNRTFPRIQDIVAGISPPYEVLPSIGRTLNFRVTVRDQAAGGGCTSEANVAVTTSATTGPFIVTSQATATTLAANGSNTFTVTWNVAGSNLAPVNCANVDILLSTDGGITYPFVLAGNTANDGSELLVVPNIPTYIGRVKVQARNNVFFNINAADITITSACAAEGATFIPNTNVSAPAGSAALNLSLNPDYGSIVTLAGTLNPGDPPTFLPVNNLAPGACILFANQFRYNTFTFTPNVPGNYTFTRGGGTSGFLIFNLYRGSFNPDDPCANLIMSNATYNGSGVSAVASFDTTLTPGLFYTFVVGTFNAGTPALPTSYNYTVTPPPGGNIYSNTPSPAGPFSYTYVIVNLATGIITAIDPSADLSNSATFPGGTSYTVVGLSYSNAIPPATLNSFVGQPFTNLYAAFLYNPLVTCGNLSKNFIVVNVLAATPVTFLGLKATKTSNNQVLLSWKTATEQDNDHFEIERSANGADFRTVLGSVTARGNSNEVVSYSFTDAIPLQKWNFYRIRQVDRDGRSSYSNIVSLQFTKPNSIVQLYPNPSNAVVILEYSSPSTEKLDISIIDNKGAVVKRIAANAMVGLNRTKIDISTLSNGIYLMKTVIAGNTIVEKIIKQ